MNKIYGEIVLFHGVQHSMSTMIHVSPNTTVVPIAITLPTIHVQYLTLLSLHTMMRATCTL